MTRAVVLLTAGLLLAGCATKPSREALANLELYGADGTWGGVLTRESLTIRAPDLPEVTIRNLGPDCEAHPGVCFFGNVGGSRYVNWTREDGQMFSLVADREPCGTTKRGQPHPYNALLYFHRNGELSDRRLLGCAGPLRKRGR